MPSKAIVPASFAAGVICGFVLCVLGYSLSAPKPTQPPNVAKTAKAPEKKLPQTDVKPPSKLADKPVILPNQELLPPEMRHPRPGEMEIVEEKLQAAPASLAFYERRPSKTGERNRVSIGIAKQQPFQVRFELLPDNQTIQKITCNGVQSGREETGHIAHALSVAVADAVIQGTALREMIYIALMESQASPKVGEWTCEVTPDGKTVVFLRDKNL